MIYPFKKCIGGANLGASPTWVIPRYADREIRREYGERSAIAGWYRIHSPLPRDKGRANTRGQLS